ncbi:MAG: ATP-binding protein [Acidobacteriota bacterium]
MAHTEQTAEEELARLRAELEEANRKLAESYKLAALGRLIAGIAHEMTTPIGSLRSNNAVALRSLDTLDNVLAVCPAPEIGKAREIVEVLRSLAGVDKIACERIVSVIPGLKAFARVEEAELRRADLNEIVRASVALIQCNCRHRIVVETDLGELPEVECYPQSLHRVFLNVLINACQAIEGQGKITVRSRREGDWVRVSISDTGRGIAPEQASKIFSLGFTTKPVGVGTGLGLAMSKESVERHGGAIDFESTPGVGTTFHIRIPVTQRRTGEKAGV